MKLDMIKVVSAVALILMAGGAWLFLDCMNKRTQESTMQAQQGLLQARAEGARRAEAKVIFEGNILANLNNCQAAAEKAKLDYFALIHKVAPSKRGQVIIPQTVTDEIESILTLAKTECQQIHDARIQKGQ